MAYAEIYLTLARVVSRYDMELHNTTLDDVQIHHARIIGAPEHDKSKGADWVQGEIEVKVARKVVA